MKGRQPERVIDELATGTLSVSFAVTGYDLLVTLAMLRVRLDTAYGTISGWGFELFSLRQSDATFALPRSVASSTSTVFLSPEVKISRMASNISPRRRCANWSGTCLMKSGKNAC